MVAQNKVELLSITRKEYQKLVKIIDTVDLATAQKRQHSDVSIKDVVAHRAHWIDLFLGWYADGLAGKTVYFPAKGYKWNELNRYNTGLRQRQAHIGWPEAAAMLAAKYGELINFIEEHSEDELYGGPMKGANNNWPPGRWAEAAGPSHFRSASKFIRSALKAHK